MHTPPAASARRRGANSKAEAGERAVRETYRERVARMQCAPRR